MKTKLKPGANARVALPDRNSIPDLAAFEAWFADASIEAPARKKFFRAITPKQIRRIVLMRAEGYAFSDIGESIGHTGSGARHVYFALPPNLRGAPADLESVAPESSVEAPEAAMLYRVASAKRDALALKVEEMAAAIDGISGDYMTSKDHHPGWVLIPEGKFRHLCDVEKTLSDLPTPAEARAVYPAWRPIEALPDEMRDGREVILRRGDRVGGACWCTWPDTEIAEGGEGWSVGCDGSSWGDEKSPTHWMPLPDPAEARPLTNPRGSK